MSRTTYPTSRMAPNSMLMGTSVVSTHVGVAIHIQCGAGALAAQ